MRIREGMCLFWRLGTLCVFMFIVKVECYHILNLAQFIGQIQQFWIGLMKLNQIMRFLEKQRPFFIFKFIHFNLLHLPCGDIYHRNFMLYFRPNGENTYLMAVRNPKFVRVNDKLEPVNHEGQTNWRELRLPEVQEVIHAFLWKILWTLSYQAFF